MSMMDRMAEMMPGAGEQRLDVPTSPAQKGRARFDAAAEGKRNKTDPGVSYRKAQGASRCSECEHWDGEAGCELVAGRIAPDGVCDLWERREDEAMPDGSGDQPPEGATREFPLED